MNNIKSDWQPTFTPGMLERRAQMLARVRAFFAARSIIEVETPVLNEFGVSDPYIASLATATASRNGRKLYLHTSPEYAMKRLLADGAPDIYQICKVFRDHELGRLHQPEFTLVEWYRRDLGFEQMIAETCAFITEICALPDVPVEQHHYRDLFVARCGIDPVQATHEQLANCATEKLDSACPEDQYLERNDWLDLLLSHLVMPQFAERSLTVVHHYPADQAALAQLDPLDPTYAERFEVFFGAVELANGYRELTDAEELRQRFNKDNELRQRAGLPAMQQDTFLLEAMDAGLPECSGVAVGFDRLVMIACGLDNMKEAMSFSQ